MCLKLYRLGRTLGLCPDNYVRHSQNTTISKHQLSRYTVRLTEGLQALQVLMRSFILKKISLG